MTRLYLIILFASLSVAGLCLLTYGLLACSRSKTGSAAESEKLALGFSDSPEQPLEILDLNMGHEGLMHREKERFDPARHRPEPLGSGKALAVGQENDPCKIKVL